MKFRVALWGLLVAGAGTAGITVLSPHAEEVVALNDPRQEPQLVRLATVTQVSGAVRSFTGVVGARVQSDLGFRLPGKIVERLVDTGQEVRAGQPLMRIDDSDLQLALTARRNAVAASRAVLVQARADEKRYAELVKHGLAASPQRYDQARAALDTAAAQLAAAEAEALVAGNEATYAVLVADEDGTVVETLAEPGQVVEAGQTVIRLARSGPREAVIALPETVRPAIGSVAEARLYGDAAARYPARLRQLSNAADPLTRTYEARYVLDGDAAAAPLGATVTLSIADRTGQPQVQVPLGAVLDNGQRTGVWIFDAVTSSVHFRPVGLVRLGDETAVISGAAPGEAVVSLGAHLLRDGAPVRAAPAVGGK